MRALRIGTTTALAVLAVAVSTGLSGCTNGQRNVETTVSPQQTPREAEAPREEWIETTLTLLCDPSISSTEKELSVRSDDPSARSQAIINLSDIISAKAIAPLGVSVVGMMIENEAGTQWSANAIFRSSHAGFPERGIPISMMVEYTNEGWQVPLNSIQLMQRRFEQLAG